MTGGALRIGRAAIVAGLASTALYLAALAVGVPLGVRMIPDAPASQLPIGMVLSTVLLASIAASVIRAVTHAVAGSGSRAFRVVAGLVLLLSFAAPLAFGDDAATKAALVLMHISVAFSIVVLLERNAT